MLSNIVKAITLVFAIIALLFTMTGCGNGIAIPKDPGHGSAPVISHDESDGAMAIVPDDVDSAIIMEPDYKGVPGDVLTPNGDIEFR